MDVLKVIGVLLIVHGIVCDEEVLTTDIPIDGNETYTSFTDSFSTLIDISLEPTTNDVQSNETEVDTQGDIIYTSEPEVDIVSIATSTEADGNYTENSTASDSTRSEEITTVTAKSNRTACFSNPCKNGGTCEEDFFDPNAYNCNCIHGYAGSHCQVSDNCGINEDGMVCLKGRCVYSKDGHSRSCTCFFGTFWDEESKECRAPDPPCFPNPCHNGTCTATGVGLQCSCKQGFEGDMCQVQNLCGDEDRCQNGKCAFDKSKMLKKCECFPDFYWDENSRTCEAIEPPCLPNACKNYGICDPISSKDFNCTCVGGYAGLTCEIQNFCTKSENGKICENGKCFYSENSIKCTCNKGYYLDEESHTCREIVEPCLPNPCSNDGKCVPLSSNSFNCTCSDGYYGATCKDMDYCVLMGGNALCGDACCQNEPNLKFFSCSCGSRQYFDYSTRSCIDIDFCPLMKCGENEKCESSNCICKENFKRKNSTGKCEPHFCPSNPCPVNDLICTEGAGISTYECGCKEGYAFNGINCNSEAVCVFPNLNACEQMCTALQADRYECSCDLDHFTLNEDNKTCTYTSNETCTNKTCDKGFCLKTGDMEQCICRPGYKEVDGKCVDLCSANDLPFGYCPDNQCESTKSGFRCKCQGKYTLSRDGTTCSVRKMCQEGEIGWKTCSERHALCSEDWSTQEGYTCHCMKGQVVSEGGFCGDVCSIEENQKQCFILGAKCDVDANEENICKCPPLFLPFQNGTACNKPASFSHLLILPLNPNSYKISDDSGSPRNKRSVDLKYADVDYEKVQADVRNALKKLFPEMLFSNVLNCRESQGYLKCKIEVQFVSVTEEDLKRLILPDICHSNANSSSVCLLPPSLLLQKHFLSTTVSIYKTDPCDSDIKEDMCGSETLCVSSPDKSSFKCTCAAGFGVRSTQYPFQNDESFLQNCKDIDECSTGNPCLENMDCQNTLGNYRCSCKPGYRLKDESNPQESGCVEICNPNPCVHGECSKVGDEKFECSCTAGYKGVLCDLQDEVFKRIRTNTIVVGAVLGGALLVVIIISITSISRLKKKKQIEDSDRMLYGTEMTDRRGADSGAVNNAYRRD